MEVATNICEQQVHFSIFAFFEVRTNDAYTIYTLISEVQFKSGLYVCLALMGEPFLLNKTAVTGQNHFAFVTITKKGGKRFKNESSE